LDFPQPPNRLRGVTMYQGRAVGASFRIDIPLPF